MPSPMFLIATRNAHKVGEIRAILGERFAYRTLKDYPAAPVTVEDAPTFAGNASKKAVELAQYVARLPAGAAPGPTHVLADDSGLEVDALQGAPGVYSARFAALDAGPAAASGNSSDADNNAKLLRLLADVPVARRTARFRCVIAFAPVLPPPVVEPSSPVCLLNEIELQTSVFDGACEGRIDVAPRGEGGFGYDPLFIPAGFTESFAQLGESTKNQLSHRAQALAKLAKYLGTEGRDVPGA
jgi:non-canonical purine NTP pyrophosphatase (RdgB/HAM1 family)